MKLEALNTAKIPSPRNLCLCLLATNSHLYCLIRNQGAGEDWVGFGGDCWGFTGVLLVFHWGPEAKSLASRSRALEENLKYLHSSRLGHAAYFSGQLKETSVNG